MTRIPDFSSVAFTEPWTAAPDSAAKPWLTPEGIAVKPVYGPEDLQGLDFLNTYPGMPPYVRGPYPTIEILHQPGPVENSVADVARKRREPASA